MKKFTLILVLFFTLQQSFSYTWESYGPEGIKANNLIHFWSDYGCSLICTDSGMYLNTNSWMPLWEYFNYPAKDAQLLNNDTLLVIANEGSYSDGIYSFNLQTYEYTNIDFLFRPNFIKYYEPGGVFYVGYETGLVKSEDGLNWTEVPYFAGKNCVDMEFFNEHIVINVSAALTHLYLSDDSGTNWFEGTNNPGWITDMAFNWQGELYGIFPDNSWSSGLWYSNDYGDNWNVEFYSVYMTALEFHNEDKLFVGWHSPTKDYEGIAIYDLQNQEFTYLNEGLPNTNINIIKSLPLIGGQIVYCCTDSGVYYCDNYAVGIDENLTGNKISIFPNPVTESTTINITLHEPGSIDDAILVYNNRGVKVDEIEFKNNSSQETEVKWNKGDLPAGVYYLIIKINKESWSEKFVIL